MASFNFNGDFRRKPEQNLGGFLNPRSTRNLLISNAKEERARRELFRKQNENVIRIQAVVRSYVCRAKIKKLERRRFDDYLQRESLSTLDDLQYLLVRLLFFHERSCDEQRFIQIGQFILKNSTLVLAQMALHSSWQHRINRLLLLSINQLFADASLAIPLRLLELFTNSQLLQAHIPDPRRLASILEVTFSYLFGHGFFSSFRKLLEQKTPPLDGPIAVAPNPFCDALLQLLVRPLCIIPELGTTTVGDSILGDFVDVMMIPEMTEPVFNLLLPYLAALDTLPIAALLRCCQERAKTTDSCYFLYGVLKLTEGHIHQLTGDLIIPYLSVVAKLLPCVWRLPRRNVSHISFAHSTDEEEAEGDDDDEDSDDSEVEDMETDTLGGLTGSGVRLERNTLREIVALLNEPRHTDQIMTTVVDGLENVTFLAHLCHICHVLMVHNRAATNEYRLVYLLSSKPAFIRSVWHTMTTMRSQGQKFSSPLSLISKGIFVPESEAIIPFLSTFCAVFSRLITTLHDDEFAGPETADIGNNSSSSSSNRRSTLMPFSVAEVVALSAVLKDVCLGLVELAFPETRPLNDHYRSVFQNGVSVHHLEENVKEHLYKVCVNLLRQIYNRDLRRNFCPDNHWTVASLNLPLDKPTDLTLDRRRRNPRPFQPIRDFTREDLDNGPPMSTKQMRSITILRGIPFVVPFNERVNILQGLLAADKLKSQGELQNFLQGPSLHIKVRRSHLYEDSFEKLSPENEPDLKPKLKVQMINQVGMDEAGIDGGGIFREFLSELIKTAFDPNRGFFMTTTDNKLYPNPSVGLIVENYHKHYYFIGRVLGKALYENLLVELPLADFFVTKLAGKQCDVDMHQLASLDPVLHKNLLSLKAYDGDVSDLGLDFTVVSHELGETRVEELKPGGSNITVNSSNRIEYIQLMADYKLNKQIRKHCVAFREGLNNVLNIEWLFMFSNVELQVLISGAEIPVDIDDLRLHAKYGGNFDGSHPTIEIFWDVVQAFTDDEKRQLLKFVTSLSRPPLLGFKDLEPPFTIQDAVDTDRLPSASTCMNLLKLPPFQTAVVLREKLLYAITANTGFELS